MRVLILEPSGQLWGSERVLLELIDSLPPGSVELAVCCPPNVPIIEQFLQRRIPMFPCFTANLHRKSRFARLTALLRFLRVVGRFRPDLIYLSAGGCAKFGVWARRLLGVPVVAGVKLVEDIAYLSSPAGQQLDRIICVSRFIRADFLRRGVIPEDSLKLIYDPYVPQFDWTAVPAVEQPRNPDEFVCVARLAHSKGQDLVVRAIAVLKNRGYPVRVRFVGDAEPGSIFAETLKELAADLDVSDCCEWLGARSNFFDYGEGCAAWLCPSRFDPFPRVMLAAIDSGSFPIAWSESGGPAELIKSSGGGLLYDDPSPESIADAMMRAALLTPEARRQIVEGGRRFIAENCNPVVNAEQTLSVWRECAQTGGRKRST